MPLPPRRRGPAWEQLGHGVQIPAGLVGHERLTEELTAWSAVLPPSHAFTGLTAARFHRLWLPPLPPGLPVFVAISAEDRVRRPGLLATRHPTLRALDFRSFRVAPIPDTLLACARDLHLLDLVVMIDSALHHHWCTLEDLRSVSAERKRGAPRLREVLRWSDGRSESAWETLLRLLHLACGIPVESQVELLDERGRFLARGDLLVSGTRTLQEFDGAGHFERGQYGRDRRRDSDLMKAGYVRNGWVAHQLIREPRLILGEALTALGRDPSTADPRPWFRMLRQSLFTEPGTKELLDHWKVGTNGTDQRRELPGPTTFR